VPTPISGSAKRCGACSQEAQCTSGRYEYLATHIHEPARQRARELAGTPEFSKAQHQRKKVEALFAELKNQIRLRRLRLRRMKFVREQFFLAAAAQNIKRLVLYLSQPPAPTVLATQKREERLGTTHTPSTRSPQAQSFSTPAPDCTNKRSPGPRRSVRPLPLSNPRFQPTIRMSFAFSQGLRAATRSHLSCYNYSLT